MCNKSLEGATAGAALNGEQLTLNVLVPSICELIGFVPQESADTILDIAVNTVITENEPVTRLSRTFTSENLAKVRFSNFDQSSTQGIEVTVILQDGTVYSKFITDAEDLAAGFPSSQGRRLTEYALVSSSSVASTVSHGRSLLLSDSDCHAIDVDCRLLAVAGVR